MANDIGTSIFYAPVQLLFICYKCEPQVDLTDLHLDEHSLDKLLRLVGDRYDRESNTLTIFADRCPLHSQNRDYCHYLLTVIRAEAQVMTTTSSVSYAPSHR